MKKIVIINFLLNLLLVFSFEVISASSDNAIAAQIGTDLTSLQNLVGDIPVLTFTSSLTSVTLFEFNFFNSSTDDSLQYVFQVTEEQNSSGLNTPLALNNTPYANFNWAPILQAINNSGVYVTLLGFDQNNQYVTSILGTNIADIQNFALAIYDSTGQIFAGMPLIFPVTNNTSGSSWQSFNQNEFYLANDSSSLHYININQYPFLLAFNASNNIPSNYHIIKALELIKAVSDLENNPVVKALELLQAVANNQIISQIGTNLDDLQNLTGDISPITHITYSLSSLSSMPGFNFNFRDSAGYINYAFITPSPDSGVFFTALHNTSYDNFDWGTVLQTINNGGVYVTLLAFDQNNQLIRSVINSENYNFNKLVLAVYDNTGVMIDGMPLVFPAGNADQSGSYQPIENILFALYSGGNILTDLAIANYPFLVALNIISPDAVANVLNLAQAVFSSINPYPVDTVVTVPSGLPLVAFNYMGKIVTGGISVKIPIVPSLSTTFLQTITTNLKNSGDEVWINLTNNGTTVTALAYNKTKINIASASMNLEQGEAIINGFYYGYSQTNLIEKIVNPANINDLWIKFIRGS